MKNILLGIIAINLTFISANLYLRSVEPVLAESYLECVEAVTLEATSSDEYQLNLEECKKLRDSVISYEDIPVGAWNAYRLQTVIRSAVEDSTFDSSNLVGIVKSALEDCSVSSGVSIGNISDKLRTSSVDIGGGSITCN